MAERTREKCRPANIVSVLRFNAAMTADRDAARAMEDAAEIIIQMQAVIGAQREQLLKALRALQRK